MNLPVYMGPSEYSQLSVIVNMLKPRHVLEWGCGGSTLAMLQDFQFIERLISIEHNFAWYEQVASEIVTPRLGLFHIPPASKEPPMNGYDATYRSWMYECERDPSIMDRYVHFPETLGIKFDFILVDGRARIHCLKVGYELLRPGGVMMLHDAQRNEYLPALSSLGDDPIFLYPFTMGQICIVRKRLDSNQHTVLPITTA